MLRDARIKSHRLALSEVLVEFVTNGRQQGKRLGCLSSQGHDLRLRPILRNIPAELPFQESSGAGYELIQLGLINTLPAAGMGRPTYCRHDVGHEFLNFGICCCLWKHNAHFTDRGILNIGLDLIHLVERDAACIGFAQPGEDSCS